MIQCEKLAVLKAPSSSLSISVAKHFNNHQHLRKQPPVWRDCLTHNQSHLRILNHPYFAQKLKNGLFNNSFDSHRCMCKSIALGSILEQLAKRDIETAFQLNMSSSPKIVCLLNRNSVHCPAIGLVSLSRNLDHRVVGLLTFRLHHTTLKISISNQPSPQKEQNSRK